MFSAINIVKNSKKDERVYSSYEIAFDGISAWSFGNHFARNVVIFRVDNSPSSHSDNRKNKFLVLGEGPTFDINCSSSSPEKSIVLILIKQPPNCV